MLPPLELWEIETCGVGVGAGFTGAAVGITAFDAELGLLVPTRLTAYTWNVYETPFVRPVTVIGEAVDVAEKFPMVDDAK